MRLAPRVRFQTWAGELGDVVVRHRTVFDQEVFTAVGSRVSVVWALKRAAGRGHRT